ncbi:cyclin-dependent kinase 2-interacting protein [Drosophila subpulchrella]|uniref:cyclin-dependent kinase 2-interacting protein n=1 Tax=Drosophila subpulchrella TaxID=1486046 RepID=UPI0018A151FB|nr:cyclin-dependent kinase 2-interacting protein [Drosophila subpulchrella]
MTKANRTPQKACEPNINASLTPVRYLDSPRLQSPTSHDSTLATCKTRLETIVKQLQDNYAKWQLAQQRGTAICYSIEAKKTKCLEKDQDDGSTSSYPDDLLLPCNKLAIIASIFGDIANNTKEMLRQLRAISKLPGATADTIFYRSWKLPQFVAFTKELAERYEQEALVKKEVAENIAHSTERSQLIAFTTLWEFPEHVDSYVQLGFLLFAEEVSLRQ